MMAGFYLERAALHIGGARWDNGGIRLAADESDHFLGQYFSPAKCIT